MKRNKNKQNEFQCDLCSYSTNNEEEIQLHVIYNHFNQCEICKRTFLNEKYLDIHLSEIHDNYFKMQQRKEKSLKCFINDCNEIFYINEERINHLKEKHHFNDEMIKQLYKQILE